MPIHAALIDHWRATLATWGPYAFGGVVVLMIALLLLNGRGGEAGLFLAAAGGVALILFGDGVGYLRDLLRGAGPLVGR